jgi:hypothetical protein
MHKGKELTRLPLSQRREVLASVIKPNANIEVSEASDRPLSEMVNFVRKHGLGIKIYTRILRNGLRSRFKHLLVWTRYSTQRDTVEFQAVEIFLEMSFTPSENVLSKEQKDSVKIIERLNLLAGEKHIPIGSYAMWSYH